MLTDANLRKFQNPGKNLLTRDKAPEEAAIYQLPKKMKPNLSHPPAY
jgi:hypothetical protein